MCYSLALNPNIPRLQAPGEPHTPPQPGQTTGPDDVAFEPAQGCIKKPLVIFIGGAGDAYTENVYTFAAWYQKDHKSYQDIYYREHSQAQSIKKLVERYKQAGQKVAVIGHSWGGCTAVRDVALKTTSDIDLLVTVDPVSRTKPSIAAKPANIKYYINIYVDYSIAVSNKNNTIARIGGPWQSVSWSDENKNMSYDKLTGDILMQYDHADFEEMFFKYAFPDVRDIK